MFKAFLLLSQLDNDDLDWILKVAKKKTIPRDQILIYEGEKINALYIVLSGNFTVFVKSLGGNELARISRGEIIGEMPFVTSRPPVATVKAIETCIVLEISRLELAARLQWNMGFAARFYRALSICLADRMHHIIKRLGDGVNLEEVDLEEIDLEEIELQGEDVEEGIVGDLELAQVKFNWLFTNAHP